VKPPFLQKIGESVSVGRDGRRRGEGKPVRAAGSCVSCRGTIGLPKEGEQEECF